MATASATYNGEEITVTFSATATDDWIGDPSVPNGTYSVTDISNICVESLDILGVTVTLESLPENLQAAIIALADEVEFTAEEPDYDDSRDYD